jgi:hypothetical protein
MRSQTLAFFWGLFVLGLVRLLLARKTRGMKKELIPSPNWMSAVDGY